MTKNSDPTGYSGKSLLKKLDMKPGSTWKIIDPPAHYFDLLVGKEDIQFREDLRHNLDGIHVFTNRIREMEEYMISLRYEIHQNGMIWFSWHKKSSGKPSEITEDAIRETALALRLVDVKVCAIDKDWSALKIVWRKENRTT